MEDVVAKKVTSQVPLNVLGTILTYNNTLYNSSIVILILYILFLYNKSIGFISLITKVDTVYEVQKQLSQVCWQSQPQYRIYPYSESCLFYKIECLQVYARNLAEKARELEYEKELSDSLLYQMLPPSVAKQLKQTQQVSQLNQSLYECIPDLEQDIFIHRVKQTRGIEESSQLAQHSKFLLSFTCPHICL